MEGYYTVWADDPALLEGQCRDCPIGRYSSVSGIESIDDCTFCPTFATTVAARSTSLSDCVCPANSVLNNETNYCDCNVGYYMKSDASSVYYCNECPIGSVRFLLFVLQAVNRTHKTQYTTTNSTMMNPVHCQRKNVTPVRILPRQVGQEVHPLTNATASRYVFFVVVPFHIHNQT